MRVELSGEGASDPAGQKRVREFPLHKGDVLYHPAYEQGKASFEAFAAEGGFLDARFLVNRIHVDLESYAASIDLRFDTGPRHYFGDVTFDTDVIDQGVLAKFVRFHEGDVFTFSRLLELQTDLSSSGWFSRVEVQPAEELTEHRVVPIAVTLTPSRRVRFTGGLGYGTDDGGRVRSLIEMRRTNSAGHHGQIELQYGQLDRRAGVEYDVPWPNPRSDVVALTSGYQKLHTNVSNSEITQGGVTLTRLLGRWQATVGLKYRQETYTVGPDDGTAHFLLPEGTWSRVRADDRIYTRRGDLLRLSLRGAHESLLSDVTFVQPKIEGKAIYGFGRARAIGRFEAGTTSTTDFRQLPPTLRFFAGGTNSVRGYSYNSLGSRDAFGSVIGGSHLLTSSVELDYLLLERWGAAVFYDLGNASEQFAGSLKRGAGFGIRWISPMGLIRADLGWGLDRRNQPVEVHIAVGPEL